MKRNLKEFLRILGWIYLMITALVMLHFGRRMLVCDSFIIPSTSMSPTLNPGDKVWVNKLLYGPRIYTSLRFGRGEPLRCIRLPGIRDIRPGDVIVFNFPYGYDDRSKVEFRINYVFCKRVLGCPGDTIGINEGHCWNSDVTGVIGVIDRQEQLRLTPDSVLFRNFTYFAMPFSRPGWNIRDFGPLTVPAKGLTIELYDFNAEVYRNAIEYETGLTLSRDDDGQILLGGCYASSYTFSQDWYFAVGDNSPDSDDSRYWGFIPDKFIIGIAAGRI